MPKLGSEFKKLKHKAPKTGPRSNGAIGRRLELTRRALGRDRESGEMSGADLCRECGIHPPNAYYQYESGKSRPTIENALLLVDTFGLSLDWIYRGEPGELKSSLLDKIKELGWKPD